eukprot:jgi/Chlat1/4899/Chrsp31S04909
MAALSVPSSSSATSVAGGLTAAARGKLLYAPLPPRPARAAAPRAAAGDAAVLASSFGLKHQLGSVEAKQQRHAACGARLGGSSNSACTPGKRDVWPLHLQVGVELPNRSACAALRARLRDTEAEPSTATSQRTVEEEDEEEAEDIDFEDMEVDEEEVDEEDAVAVVEDAAGVQWVEVGTVVSTHGLRGELRVRGSTDFPEERFQQPGVKWLRAPRVGRYEPEVLEVQLVKGRYTTAGKWPGWLAVELVGHTMVIPADERPPLDDEDEFYVQDLVGLAVYKQADGEHIGEVVDIYASGANDLLKVKLVAGVGGAYAWVPFVKEIVPVGQQTDGDKPTGGTPGARH